jgi:hypothetical protein
MANGLWSSWIINQDDQWYLVKMTNGIYSSWTFSQDNQWSLIKYNMVYYPIYLPLAYSSTYLFS